MTKLVFIEPSGNRREITATVGESVMQAATANGVVGIDAECGGSCMCATCHCLVIEPPNPLPDMQSDEADTLEFTAEDMKDNSRLTCQVTVTPELEGIVFQVIGR
ncbi:2Fe-2S iron-sulfur cluster-binding protein [Roseinatronobacter sp.]|uniref:2Fe-2S iron-sulfur cluster-binding protein n=1 Tax=Roseinatronobacter sp. TaxID=1945755 RepID=UPI0025F0FE78|nr:2Fe-2S iron-sulfur cluster-binding protein [Roseibaca sp.]